MTAVVPDVEDQVDELEQIDLNTPPVCEIPGCKPYPAAYTAVTGCRRSILWCALHHARIVGSWKRAEARRPNTRARCDHCGWIGPRWFDHIAIRPL